MTRMQITVLLTVIRVVISIPLANTTITIVILLTITISTARILSGVPDADGLEQTCVRAMLSPCPPGSAWKKAVYEHMKHLLGGRTRGIGSLCNPCIPLFPTDPKPYTIHVELFLPTTSTKKVQHTRALSCFLLR